MPLIFNYYKINVCNHEFISGSVNETVLNKVLYEETPPPLPPPPAPEVSPLISYTPFFYRKGTPFIYLVLTNATGGIVSSAEGTSLVEGVWGFPPPDNCQIWRLQNNIFSIGHEICLRKIDLEYENGKQLQ